MNRVRNGAIVIVVLIMMLLSGIVQAQVMQQIPSSALLVVKVNNLKAVNEKLAKLAQDLGIAAMAPPVADPLAFFQVQSGMQKGLDVNGELAFVMLDPASVPGATGPDDAIVILAPVTDFKTFLSNWPGAKSEGDITEIKFGGDTSYTASWGKYAAIAPGKAVLASKSGATGGLTAPSVTTKELAGKDIILYANMNTLRGKLLPEVQQVRAQASNSIEGIFAAQPQLVKFSAVMKALLNQVFNVADTYLKDGEAATVGLSFVPEGINATVMSEFSPGSYLGKTTGAVKGTDAPLLSGLPTGKYLFYGGGVSDPVVTGKLFSDIVDPIVTELLAVGPEWTVAKEYADAMKQAVTATKSTAFAMVAPQGAVGATPLMQVISIQSGDTQLMRDANAKMLAAQNRLMAALNLPGTQGMLPKFTQNAKVVDGVNFDSMILKMEADAQNPMAMQQAQMMNIIYGPEGAVSYLGSTGDKMLVFTGVSDAVISSTIAAVKNKISVLDQNANIKAVSSQLPKQRVSVAYIALGDIATTGLSYAKQFGLALPVMLPPDLPPIGISTGTEATAIRIDVHVPTSLVQSFIAAGLQAQMQMQGGPPPGGGL